MTRYRKLVGMVAAAILLAGGLVIWQNRHSATDPALDTATAYLRATYARNFTEAYNYLSSADRQVRPAQNFVNSQGAYSGFTLQVARQLARYMKIWLVERQAKNDRLVIKVGYQVPAPAELNGLLLSWDQDRLNGLSQAQQTEILRELDARNRNNKLVQIEGQETIELVKDAPGWRIFLDWASGTRVLLASKLANANKLTVRFATSEVMAKSDELFLVNLTIKNSTTRPVSFTVGHLLEPASVADDLQLVECGLLTPTTLDAGQEKEFAMAYQLNTAAGQSHRQIKLTYEFKLK